MGNRQENEEEEEVVDFETEYYARHKSQQKQGASNRIIKIMQLEDEPLQSIPCRIKKVIEIEEDLPTATTSIT